MRQIFLCRALLFAALLAGGSCSLPPGEPYSGKGTLTLLPPETPAQGRAAQNGAAPRSVISDADRAALAYKLSLTGPGESRSLETGGEGAAVLLEEGEWAIEAEAYKPGRAAAVGSGSAVITVIAGQNSSVRIPMELEAAYEASLTEIYIHNEEDLRRVAAGGFAIDGSVKFYLERDIVLSRPWTPIGGDTAPFKAEFNGNGKTVTINAFTDASLSGEYLGFFGCTAGAEIKNLRVHCNLGTGAPLALTVPFGSEGVFYVGALAGSAEDSLFENVSVSGSIKVTSAVTNRIELGGIAGSYEFTTSGAIRSSHVRADLSAVEQQGNVEIGGVVGSAGGVVSGTRTIEECSFTGTLQGKGAGVNAGGIAGSNAVNSAITACYASGVIIAEADDYAYAGGIAGFNIDRIERCYAWADVHTLGNVSGTDGANAGGIAGYLGAGTDGILSQCYALGQVVAAGPANKKYVGGIAGYNYEGAIEYCAALNGDISHPGTSGGFFLNWIAGNDSGTSVETYTSNYRPSDGASIDSTSLGVIAGNGIDYARAAFERPTVGTVYDSGKLDWDFATDWKWIDGYDYPVLAWQTRAPADLATLQ